MSHTPSKRLATGGQEFGGWFLLDKHRAVANRTKLGRLYSLREILLFARRGDCDDVACEVLNNPEHPRGTVLLIHDGAMRGSEVEKVIASRSQ